MQNRFFALPGEVRNHVYRQILVRPCKFDMNHTSDCPGPIIFSRPGPAISPEGIHDYLCACCNYKDWKRTPQIQTFKSPARSQWAAQLNTYICDNCYWDNAGYKEGKPCMKSIHCLCTRHRNLQILLINKRFYNEAAPIFWGENIFAFEHPCLLTGFLSTIRPQVRSWIRRISFLPLHEYIRYDEQEDGHDTSVMWARFEFQGDRSDDWQGWRQIKHCWQLLRQCDGLVELELDALCLKRLEEARLIRLIHVKGKLTFSRHPQKDEFGPRWFRRGRSEAPIIDDSPFIWWSHSRRMPVSTPTTELMASSMENQALKAKVLKRHYMTTDFQERCGGDYYSEIIGED